MQARIPPASKQNYSILLLDATGEPSDHTAQVLREQFYRLTTLSDPVKALETVKSAHFDLVVGDFNFGGGQAMRFLSDLYAYDPTIPSLLVTDHGTVSMAIEAMKCGAQGFVIRPFKPEELLESVQAALDHAQLVRETLQMQFFTPMVESLSAALLNILEGGDYNGAGDSQ